METREKWRPGFSLTKGESLVVYNAREAALREGEVDFANRLRAIWLLGCKKVKRREVAEILEVTDSCLTGWVKRYREGGVEGLRSKKAPGAPSRLSDQQLERLQKELLKGPEELGYDTGTWTGPLVRAHIQKRFDVSYSVSHVRRILHQLGFSVQYPKKILSEADRHRQERWLKSEYPKIKKKAQDENGVVLFEDEAVFQQEGTIARTWGPVGKGVEVKSKPVRRSVKVLGAVRIDEAQPKFHFNFTPARFNAVTFLHFLIGLVEYYASRGKKIHLILDGAAYHKSVVEWAESNGDLIELHFLPAYSPELNPVEQIWRRTKALATHNRYFPDLDTLRGALFRRFNRYQGNPASLRGLISSWV